jgi:hypothetical protein
VPLRRQRHQEYVRAAGLYLFFAGGCGRDVHVCGLLGLYPVQ